MNKEDYLKRLQIKYPDILSKYSYDLLPFDFSINDYIHITCHEHGVFTKKALNHFHYSHGCNACSLIRRSSLRKLTTEEFVKKSKAKFGDKFDYTKTKYNGVNTELILDCDVHGELSIRANQHMWCKHGCPKCDYEIPRIIKKKKVIEKANKIHKNKYDYSKIDYRNVNSKVEIICPKHGSFFQTLAIHVGHQAGCPTCARNEDKLTQEEFIQRAIAIHGNKYSYEYTKYKDSDSKVIINCPEHGLFEQRAGSHVFQGNGCKKCFLITNRSNTEDFIKKAKEIHGDAYDYSKVIYKHNKSKIDLICKIHGLFKIKPNAHLNSKVGCPKCSESKGEREVSLILDKYKIQYIREYKLNGYLYRYDFYIPGTNIFIEFHGQQHYKPVEIFGGVDSFNLTVYRDSVKKNLVKEQKGKLIVLNYTDRSLGLLEKKLIRELKTSYNYWLILNGELRVFKRLKDLRKEFNFSDLSSEETVLTYIKNTYQDFKQIF